MNSLSEAITTILVAITGVAIVALLVSKKSQTAAVIQAGFSGFGNALGVAVAPVTGDKIPLDLSYPSTGNGFGGGGFGAGFGVSGW